MTKSIIPNFPSDINNIILEFIYTCDACHRYQLDKDLCEIEACDGGVRCFCKDCVVDHRTVCILNRCCCNLRNGANVSYDILAYKRKTDEYIVRLKRYPDCKSSHHRKQFCPNDNGNDCGEPECMCQCACARTDDEVLCHRLKSCQMLELLDTWSPKWVQWSWKRKFCFQAPQTSVVSDIDFICRNMTNYVENLEMWTVVPAGKFPY